MRSKHDFGRREERHRFAYLTIENSSIAGFASAFFIVMYFAGSCSHSISFSRYTTVWTTWPLDKKGIFFPVYLQTAHASLILAWFVHALEAKRLWITEKQHRRCRRHRTPSKNRRKQRALDKSWLDTRTGEARQPYRLLLSIREGINRTETKWISYVPRSIIFFRVLVLDKVYLGVICFSKLTLILKVVYQNM